MIKNKLKQLTALISASFVTDSSQALKLDDVEDSINKDNTISVTPLNTSVSTYLAAHRSHSSHGSHQSHGSHRSSSSGGFSSSTPKSPPVKTAPPPPSPPVSSSANTSSSVTKKSDPLGQPARPETSYPPAEKKKLEAALQDSEKRKNIIMRIQLSLKFDDLYKGPVNGIMDEDTRKGILSYKKSKGLKGDALLDAPTLNAFGIVGF